MERWELDTIKKYKADWEKNQIEYLEINILATEVKNSTIESNSKLDTARERINNPEDISEDIIHKCIKKNEDKEQEGHNKAVQHTFN